MLASDRLFRGIAPVEVTVNPPASHTQRHHVSYIRVIERMARRATHSAIHRRTFANRTEMDPRAAVCPDGLRASRIASSGTVGPSPSEASTRHPNSGNQGIHPHILGVYRRFRSSERYSENGFSSAKEIEFHFDHRTSPVLPRLRLDEDSSPWRWVGVQRSSAVCEWPHCGWLDDRTRPD